VTATLVENVTAFIVKLS